jgi:branched-chain amino acid transport system ATP-binding protein
MSTLKVDRVTMQFGGLIAVSDFSLTVEEGELVGLIGPNGAGKTTAFNMISGIYKPTEGRIYFNQTDITGWRPDRTASIGIARTFQNVRLFSGLSVADNVMIGHHLRLKSSPLAAILSFPGYKREEKDMYEESMGLLERLGLSDLAEREAGGLPYGSQRRVEIARALATEPRLLLLDEAAAGMSVEEAHDLMDFIQKVRQEFGLAILLIEHQMRVIMGICERIVVLDHGVQIAEGTPQEIQDNPRVIEAYLGVSENA